MKMIDLKLLLSRVDYDIEFLVELIDVFLKENPFILDKLRNAVSARNCCEVSRVAHLIKGTVGSFAATSVAQMALQIENMGKSEDMENIDNLFKNFEATIEQLKDALIYLKNMEPDKLKKI